MKKEDNTKLIVIIALLLIGIAYMLFTANEVFINKDKHINSMEVTIIRNHAVHSYDGGTSYYMYGESKTGETITILGNDYSVGDVATVYINRNTLNAHGTQPEWHTTLREANGTYYIGLIMSSIFTIAMIVWLIDTLKYRRTMRYEYRDR